MGYEAVSLDKCILTFCSIAVPSPAKVEWTRKTLHSCENIWKPKPTDSVSHSLGLNPQQHVVRTSDLTSLIGLHILVKYPLHNEEHPRVHDVA